MIGRYPEPGEQLGTVRAFRIPAGHVELYAEGRVLVNVGRATAPASAPTVELAWGEWSVRTGTEDDGSPNVLSIEWGDASDEMREHHDSVCRALLGAVGADTFDPWSAS